MTDNKKRFICGGCSLLCDDVEFIVKNNKVIDTYNCCGRANENYKCHDSENRILKPFIRENDTKKEISYEEAIEKAKDILSNAKNPLIYGFTNTGCEEIFQGIILARKLNTYIDTQQSTCLGVLNNKLKEYKIRPIKLEKIKKKTDLIIFWGSNVSDLHLRLASKYAVFPRTGQIQQGKESRTVVTIDIRPTPTEKIADEAYYVEPGKDKELIDALLELNQGKRIKDKKIAGISLKKVKDFYELLQDSENKIIFIGPGLTAGNEGYKVLDSLVKLANEMNIDLLATTSDANTYGCDIIMRTMTKYPFAVSYKNDSPEFNISKFDITKLIANNEIDAALIVNADPLARLPFQAAKKLASIPMIVIDHHNTLTTDLAKMVIPMKMTGVEIEGTFVRMDGRIRVVDKIIDPPEGILSGAEIIKKIQNSV
ncbi:MAG: formylmethanofuran dehydrogenase subunit B [Candidatus Lokiarchaeota archaeon]|nr:formylmethanofuran dehydrogenase subunit B [Candidatus Lokiarchaeota archaeon]